MHAQGGAKKLKVTRWRETGVQCSYVSRLFKSFEFGNGSRISDENLVILEFKYLQNKKW